MAFRTNKTPVLQEKTASGSVASFNTILQKPLVNGEFTIQAYQEGSGDPSPSNVRNIVGFSAINISHSDGVNTPVIHTKSLGETVYGGSYNSVSGVMRLTHKYILLSSLGWSYSTGSVLFASQSLDDIKAATSQSELTTIISNSYKTTSVSGRTNYSIMCSTNNRIWIVDNDYTDATAFKTAKANVQIVYPLETPIEIQLDPTEIKTFNGSNNIFCDTGDTSVVYNDLDLAKRGSFREVFKLP